MTHQPVLLQEVIEALAPQPGEVLVDATVNRAGHARALCPLVGNGGLLIGIDADATALAEARERLTDCPCPVRLINGNFREMAVRIRESGIDSVDCVLMDLGLSSDELERSGRGFSFQRDEPLLMTFASDPEPGVLTAAQIVNSWSEERLVEILREFGEERFARPIAKAIVTSRRRAALHTTGQLVAVIEAAVPAWYRQRRIHPATKTFQALRMATNDELGALQEGLVAAWGLLAANGRLAVISFHSLEARLVKVFFQQLVRDGQAEFVHKKARLATYAETRSNPRARSAQLRTIKKLA